MGVKNLTSLVAGRESTNFTQYRFLPTSPAATEVPKATATSSDRKSGWSSSSSSAPQHGNSKKVKQSAQDTLMRPASLHPKAKDFRHVVIDANSLFHHIAEQLQLQGKTSLVLGGGWDAFVFETQQILRAWQRVCSSVVVVFDGEPMFKEQTNAGRVDEYTGIATHTGRRFHKFIGHAKDSNVSLFAFRLGYPRKGAPHLVPVWVSDMFYHAASSVPGILILQAAHENDAAVCAIGKQLFREAFLNVSVEHSADFAAGLIEPAVFLLSQDSDYFAFINHGCRYVPLTNIEYVQAQETGALALCACKYFCASSFCESAKLPPCALPLYATLCGNDYVDRASTAFLHSLGFHTDDDMASLSHAKLPNEHSELYEIRRLVRAFFEVSGSVVQAHLTEALGCASVLEHSGSCSSLTGLTEFGECTECSLGTVLLSEFVRRARSGGVPGFSRADSKIGGRAYEELIAFATSQYRLSSDCAALPLVHAPPMGEPWPLGLLHAADCASHSAEQSLWHPVAPLADCRLYRDLSLEDTFNLHADLLLHSNPCTKYLATSSSSCGVHYSHSDRALVGSLMLAGMATTDGECGIAEHCATSPVRRLGYARILKQASTSIYMAAPQASLEDSSPSSIDADVECTHAADEDGTATTLLSDIVETIIVHETGWGGPTSYPVSAPYLHVTDATDVPTFLDALLRSNVLHPALEAIVEKRAPALTASPDSVALVASWLFLSCFPKEAIKSYANDERATQAHVFALHVYRCSILSVCSKCGRYPIGAHASCKPTKTTGVWDFNHKRILTNKRLGHLYRSQALIYSLHVLLVAFGEPFSPIWALPALMDGALFMDLLDSMLQERSRAKADGRSPDYAGMQAMRGLCDDGGDSGDDGLCVVGLYSSIDDCVAALKADNERRKEEERAREEASQAKKSKKKKKKKKQAVSTQSRNSFAALLDADGSC